MSKIWQQLAGIWSRLEVPQKATIVLVILGAIVLAGVLAYGASRPDYRLLAQGLTKSQTAEIAAYLDSSHISYQVADNETAILVPSKDLYRLRNELAEREMLGDGSKGFELLGKGAMWESTFSEHRTYDRAVGGELERSFRELPGVRSARVIIDRPQPSPFVNDDAGKPKASVKLDMKPGTRLSERQIAGILHLTAGAVAGLSPERVEIMDGGGLLTPKAADSGAAMAQTTLEAESAREAYLTRKAQELLDATLGPGRSSVKVSVKMDFTKRSTATSDPTKSVMLRENTRTSDEKTPVMPAGGVTGTAPNVEGEGQTTAAKPAMGSKTQEEVKNEYVVGKSTVTQEDEVGRISGMTVSILLDYKTVREPKKDDKGNPTKEMEEKRVEYTDTERKRFQDLVLNAIGFNSARGLAAQGGVVQNVDNRFSVTVQSLEMWREPTEPVKAGLPLNLPMNLSDMAGYIIAGVVALALIIIARSQLSRSHRAWAEAESRARAKAEDEERRKKVEVRNEEEEEEDSNEAQAMRQRRQELRDKIRKQVSEDPASAAQIVRKWLYEGA
jgi:flagellar M-ring protein FliF